MNNTYKNAMTGYIAAFNAGDLDGLLSLFTDAARIYSPTQPEPKTPGDFFPALLQRSKGTVFELKAMFFGDTPQSAAMLFDYKKMMDDGSVKIFDCVDVFHFDEAGKIEDMRIVFDTKKLGL